MQTRLNATHRNRSASMGVAVDLSMQQVTTSTLVSRMITNREELPDACA
jgi:hypothetical protein